LALADGVAHCLLVILAAEPASLQLHAFTSSLADATMLAASRCLLLLAAASLGSSRNLHRPLAGCAIALFLLTTVFLSVKSAFFAYSTYDPRWLPPAVFALGFSLSALHVASACARVGAARRSTLSQMGLSSSALLSHARSTSAPLDPPEDRFTTAVALDTPACDQSNHPPDRANDSAFASSSKRPHPPRPRRHQLGVRREENTGMTMPLLNGDLDADMRADDLADDDSRFTIVNGVRLHLKSCGEPTCSHVVFLVHGFGGGTFSWRRLAPAIAARNSCRVIAVDRPGFGLSCPPEGHYRPEGTNAEPSGYDRSTLSVPLSSTNTTNDQSDEEGSDDNRGNATDDDSLDSDPYAARMQAKIFVELLRAEKAHDVVLAGHSDGCLVCVLAAEDAFSRPEPPFKLHGLCMVSPNFNRDVLPTTTRLMLDTSLPLPMLRPLLRSELGELASRRGCHHPNSLSQDVIDMYRKPLHVKGWDKALQQMNTRKKEISSKELADALEAVAHMPTRIMSGQNDRAVPQSRVRAMASELPEAEVSFFAHCGHLPQEECPNELLEQVVAFIDAALKQSRDDGGQGKSPAVESPQPESSSRSLRMGPFASDEAFALSKLGLPSTPTP